MNELIQLLEIVCLSVFVSLFSWRMISLQMRERRRRGARNKYRNNDLMWERFSELSDDQWERFNENSERISCTEKDIKKLKKKLKKKEK